ncbi:MAG: hypothetical protein IPI29_03095 [Ignavibacteria bacterium]|nr:hypothetical protein [Ignavibacteria bacterium]
MKKHRSMQQVGIRRELTDQLHSVINYCLGYVIDLLENKLNSLETFVALSTP